MKSSPVVADLERFRLRTFVQALGVDALDTHREAMDLIDIAAHLEGNPKAVLIERPGGGAVPLCGNVMSSRARLARAFDTTPDKLVAEVLRRLGTPQPILDVPRDQAPVQQVVVTHSEKMPTDN